MVNRSLRSACVVLMAFGAVASLDAAATAQRTFVRSDGHDSNACSLAAPCRGFAAAMAQTSPGGEVVVLDSAGYGPVVISQAVTLVAPPGVYAGISVFAGTGVTVNAGPGNEVTLRGLTINSLGGTTGIAFNSGDALYIDSVIVSGFSGAGGIGLNAAPGAATAGLFIQDSTFRDNAVGLWTTTTSGTLTLEVERAVFERDSVGAAVQGNVVGSIHASAFIGGATGVAAGSAAQTTKLELRDCTISDNSGAGVAAIVAATASTTLSVVSSLVSGNAFGLQVANTGNTIYASDNTITRNTTGVSASASATVVSGIDNRLVNNGTDGTFSSSIPKI